MNTEAFSKLPKHEQDMVLEMRAEYATLPEHDKARMRVLVMLTNRHDEKLRPLMDAFSKTHTMESFRRVCDYLDKVIVEREAQS